ncbi:endonuclease domain-containing 1 protein-like [Sinocyclocheilus rhinocerous]|uniref:endonuclease domain-containing 1 protein-like n=1 Tax=Sinocyclocheilus rhinocerous TaxID=307959 RepID=UPI0007BA60FF|nr:PREDICTED: endonuclease domain-containing 1 protein-like [Sinocyclocheilus rhinocerous]
MFVPALLTCIVLRAFSAQAKVADDFDCKEFFYKDTEPVGMDQNAKKICQFTANLGPHYATLYSINHKIPLYSAYRFDPTCLTDSGRPSFWHLEPQISKPEEQTQYYMVRENQNYKRAYKGEQAISDDYSETGYDKGHLNPNSFQCGAGRIATFTLTNAAPMDAVKLMVKSSRAAPLPACTRTISIPTGVTQARRRSSARPGTHSSLLKERTVDGQTCRSNHKCGYHEKDYLWCYTDYEDNWDYCCKSCW